MGIPLQNIYVQNVTPPAAIVDNAAFTTAEIDTVIGGVKYNYLTVLVSFGAMDIAVSAMALQHSDTSGSNFANVTGFVGGTDFTLPSATADNTIYAFQVDLRGKRRYFDLSLTGGNGSAGTFCSVMAILSQAEETPITAAQKGFAVEIIG
jgi:hypothetical protein